MSQHVPTVQGASPEWRDETDRMQELFVPVHGHILLFPEEIALIDHPAFQRLRRVRQLGFAHMVFPGVTHARFEHSIGAVHTAQTIIDHVNTNFRRQRNAADGGEWQIVEIDYPTARLIRLAALLHDVGHLPFGHTLEDELNHLPSHDGGQRLARMAAIRFPHHEVDKSVLSGSEKPKGGWSLHDLISRLYQRFTLQLGVQADPFVVLTQIICKPPTGANESAEWQKTAVTIMESVNLGLCRDVVGNTICADFLDYLYRDWHHLGKPLYRDTRLYQYMEVRKRQASGNGQEGQPRFVINVGASEKIRHDALTDILELLTVRYKLAETVLFHRTKLALTGLLDRCLLEIEGLYLKAGFSRAQFLQVAEDLLVQGSDDALPSILKGLAAGGTGEGRAKLFDALREERRRLEADVAAGAPVALSLEFNADENDGGSRPIGELEAQAQLVDCLIARVTDRAIYTLVYKLRMSDFPGAHEPENPRLTKLLRTYGVPRNRLDFVQKMELLCGLPPGSLVMYCPQDATMNAKVAKVNLFIEGEVTAFDEYEKTQKGASLTRGALLAQVERFYELWSAQVYMERTSWDSLSDAGQRNLKAALQAFFFHMDQNLKPEIRRSHVEVSITAVRNETRAARLGSADPAMEKCRDFTFPSGLAFRVDVG